MSKYASGKQTMNSHAEKTERVSMGQTMVKLPFGGCVSTSRAAVRRITPVWLLIAGAGVLGGFLLFF